MLTQDRLAVLCSLLFPVIHLIYVFTMCLFNMGFISKETSYQGILLAMCKIHDAFRFCIHCQWLTVVAVEVIMFLTSNKCRMRGCLADICKDAVIPEIFNIFYYCSFWKRQVFRQHWVLFSEERNLSEEDVCSFQQLVHIYYVVLS